MDVKKMAGIVALILVVLWIIGRVASKQSQNSAVSAAQSGQSTPQDKWVVKEDRSSMDDSRVVTLSLDSEDVIQGPIGPKRPSLIVRCKEGKTVVYVATGMAAAVEDHDGLLADDHTIRIRLDQGEAQTQLWSESTSHSALFSLDGIQLAKQLAGARTMTFQFMPFDANPAVMRFDLRGLDAHLLKVAEACGWTMN